MWVGVSIPQYYIIEKPYKDISIYIYIKMEMTIEQKYIRYLETRRIASKKWLENNRTKQNERSSEYYNERKIIPSFKAHVNALARKNYLKRKEKKEANQSNQSNQ